MISRRFLDSLISSLALFLALFTVVLSATAQTSVTVTPLSELAIYPDRFAPATVISLNQPMLSAQITAQVEAVPVRVGDIVKAGEVLVELDCSEYSLDRKSAQASLESTQARYALARKNWQRTQSLMANKLVSIEALDSSRTELDALTASLKSSRASLKLNRLYESRCEITAPFDALVVDRMASVGQLATPGTAVAELLDLNSLEISAQIFAGDAHHFDTPMELFLEAQDKFYPVQLNKLIAALDSATRNREARLVFTGEAALPGSSGKLRWNDPRPHLPSVYVIERNGELGFFALNDSEGKAEFHAIPLAQSGRMNPVDEPLELLVITEGYSGLGNGDSLTIEAAQ